MKNFNSLYYQLIESNIAGGEGSVFGSVDAGAYGNQFPSQNDAAYAPGDARNLFGIPSKGKPKKKKSKFKLYRRPKSSM